MVLNYPIYTLFGMRNLTEFLVLSVLCLAGSNLEAQMTLDWQRSLGGSDTDISRDIIVVSSGGYLVVGETLSDDGDVTHNYGGQDAWMARMDKQGNLLWQKTLGGSLDESFQSVVETADGGFVLAGFTYSSDGDVSGGKGAADCWLVRVDSLGNMVWERSLGGANGESALSVVSNPDGGFTIAGYTYSADGDVSSNHGNSDVWVLKVDFLGNTQWQKSYGGSEDEWGTDLITTSDGGYAIAAWTGSNDGDISGKLKGVYDFWLLKIAANGAVQWEKTYGGNKTDKASSLTQSFDGGYVIAGYTTSDNGDVSGHHGSEDFWVVKTDGNGELVWQQALGGLGAERASDLVELSNNNLVVAGHTFSSNGDVTLKVGGFYDFWLTELDPEGNLKWEFAFGGSEAEYVHAMTVSPDDAYVVVGETLSNDKDVSGNHGFTDGWVVKTRPWATAIDPAFEMQLGLNVFPNPTNDLLKLSFTSPLSGTASLELINIQGQSFFHQNLPHMVPQFYQFELSLADLPRGVYLLRLNLAGQAVSRLVYRK